MKLPPSAITALVCVAATAATGIQVYVSAPDAESFLTYLLPAFQIQAFFMVGGWLFGGRKGLEIGAVLGFVCQIFLVPGWVTAPGTTGGTTSPPP